MFEPSCVGLEGLARYTTGGGISVFIPMYLGGGRSNRNPQLSLPLEFESSLTPCRRPPLFLEF